MPVEIYQKIIFEAYFDDVKQIITIMSEWAAKQNSLENQNTIGAEKSTFWYHNSSSPGDIFYFLKFAC